MAEITLGGNPAKTNGNLPEVGTQLSDFKLTNTDMGEVSLSDYKGKKVILNIFPSVDTDVCATSVRKFNEQVAGKDNTVVLCISKDLPFAQKRFCGAEGIEEAIPLSDFKSDDFSQITGTRIQGGPFDGLHARAVIVLDEEGKITHTELVSEVGEEPNYEAALAGL